MIRYLEIIESGDWKSEIRNIVREENERLMKDSNQVNKSDKLLSRKEVMERLNISSTTLWARMNDGSINFRKFGRRVFFRHSDVEAALNSDDI